MSRSYKKAYTKSKAIDATCRSHGGCPWCESNRLFNRNKISEKEIKKEIVEYFMPKIEGRKVTQLEILYTELEVLHEDMEDAEYRGDAQTMRNLQNQMANLYKQIREQEYAEPIQGVG